MPRVAARVAAALLALALLVAVDAASKTWAATELRARGPRTVAGGQVRLRYHQNPGVAFGLLGGERRPAALVAASVLMAAALLGGLVHLLWRPRPGALLLVLGLVPLIAGTLGNVRDRLVRGHVVDFIEYGGRWPIFNVADACLVAGTALCLFGLGRVWLAGPSRVAV